MRATLGGTRISLYLGAVLLAACDGWTTGNAHQLYWSR
jgi:hypothetical protein